MNVQPGDAVCPQATVPPVAETENTVQGTRYSDVEHWHESRESRVESSRQEEKTSQRERVGTPTDGLSSAV